MLCKNCEIEMRITTCQYEASSTAPIKVELVQTLVCPKCKSTEQIRNDVNAVNT